MGEEGKKQASTPSKERLHYSTALHRVCTELSTQDELRRRVPIPFLTALMHPSPSFSDIVNQHSRRHMASISSSYSLSYRTNNHLAQDAYLCTPVTLALFFIDIPTFATVGQQVYPYLSFCS